MEWDRDISRRGITDQLKEMQKCQHQAIMPGWHCGARWWDGDERASHWLQKPRAELTGGRRSRGASWASDGLGWGWHVCMSVFVYVCVWELLSLFNRHWKRKQKIYSNMTKIKGIVHSRRVNILPLFTHFHVILNLSFFCGTQKEDISWKIHLFTDNPILQAVYCKTICESMTQRVELKNWINEHMIL